MVSLHDTITHIAECLTDQAPFADNACQKFDYLGNIPFTDKLGHISNNILDKNVVQVLHTHTMIYDDFTNTYKPQTLHTVTEVG